MRGAGSGAREQWGTRRAHDGRAPRTAARRCALTFENQGLLSLPDGGFLIPVQRKSAFQIGKKCLANLDDPQLAFHACLRVLHCPIIAHGSAHAPRGRNEGCAVWLGLTKAKLCQSWHIRARGLSMAYEELLRMGKRPRGQKMEEIKSKWRQRVAIAQRIGANSQRDLVRACRPMDLPFGQPQQPTLAWIYDGKGMLPTYTEEAGELMKQCGVPLGTGIINRWTFPVDGTSLKICTNFESYMKERPAPDAPSESDGYVPSGRLMQGCVYQLFEYTVFPRAYVEGNDPVSTATHALNLRNKVEEGEHSGQWYLMRDGGSLTLWQAPGVDPRNEVPTIFGPRSGWPQSSLH